MAPLFLQYLPAGSPDTEKGGLLKAAQQIYYTTIREHRQQKTAQKFGFLPVTQISSNNYGKLSILKKARFRIIIKIQKRSESNDHVRLRHPKKESDVHPAEREV